MCGKSFTVGLRYGGGALLAFRALLAFTVVSVRISSVVRLLAV